MRECCCFFFFFFQTRADIALDVVLNLDRHATRSDGGIPMLLLRLSVTGEKKNPHVVFAWPVWKGTREFVSLGVEVDGRERAT